MDATDQVSKEIHHEEIAELQVLFPALRDFFRGSSQHMESIRKEMGEFPTTWQELKPWKYYKSLRKRYLAFLDGVILPLPVPTIVESVVVTSSEDVAPLKGKRSRWGAVTTEGETSEAPLATTSAPSKRRSRWGKSESTAVVVPTTNNSLVPSNNNSVLHRLGLCKTLTPEEEQEVMLLKVKIQQAEAKCEPACVMRDALMLPEVAPQYDAATGLRKNTPEARMKEQRAIELDTLIEKMLALDPLYIPPPCYVRKKPSAKLYIPHKEYPTYNFIGLVIGPRGMTQKAMEKDTGCKILIRGRGSVKEGARGRGVNEDEDDELHVFVTGDSRADVDKAVAMIKPLLVPTNEETNEHKQSQLRELALINGTVRPEDYCPLCGEQGHRQFECPSHTSKSLHNANVRCTFCGETTHPSRDCPVERARKSGVGETSSDHVVLDQEYNSFISELDGRTPEPPPPPQPEDNAVAPEVTEAPVPTTSESPSEPSENVTVPAPKDGSGLSAEVGASPAAATPPDLAAQQLYYAQAYAQQQQYMVQQYQAYGMQYDPVHGWYYPYQQQQP